MSKQEPIAAEGAVYYLFGATGDLARRKLFPALFSLYKEGKLAENFAVVGLARSPRTNEQFRADLYESIVEFCRYNWRTIRSFGSNLPSTSSICRLILMMWKVSVELNP